MVGAVALCGRCEGEEGGRGGGGPGRGGRRRRPERRRRRPEGRRRRVAAGEVVLLAEVGPRRAPGRRQGLGEARRDRRRRRGPVREIQGGRGRRQRRDALGLAAAAAAPAVAAGSLVVRGRFLRRVGAPSLPPARRGRFRCRRGKHDACAADEDVLARRLGGRRPRRHRGQARGPREPGPTCLVTFVDVERRQGSFWLEGALHKIRRCDGFLFDKCSLRPTAHRLKLAHLTR